MCLLVLFSLDAGGTKGGKQSMQQTERNRKRSRVACITAKHGSSLVPRASTSSLPLCTGPLLPPDSPACMSTDPKHVVT